VSQPNVRKAALLLAALDSATAAELLKSAPPDRLTEIAAELAYIHQNGLSAQDRLMTRQPVQEFFDLMHGKKTGFLQEVLESAVGKNKSQEMLVRIGQMLEARDPFRAIRTVPVEDIAKSLEGESAQVATLVLAELPSKNAAKLLPLLADSVRSDAVRGMTGGVDVSPEARVKVAGVIRQRLDDMAAKGLVGGGSADEKRQQQLRKVAVLLRGLQTAFRDSLLRSMATQDQKMADAVQKMMVIWEDMPLVTDRSLQEILRTVESKKLAMSLVKAEPATAKKIRDNISQRASMMLDEEMSLLNNPKADDITAAREAILDALRALNAKGELPLEGA
jgi:flagellar motor switch protein FliG